MHVVCMREMGNAYKILVGKPEGTKLFRRPSQYSIKLILRKRKCVDWIHLAQGGNQ